MLTEFFIDCFIALQHIIICEETSLLWEGWGEEVRSAITSQYLQNFTLHLQHRIKFREPFASKALINSDTNEAQKPWETWKNIGRFLESNWKRNSMILPIRILKFKHQKTYD